MGFTPFMSDNAGSTAGKARKAEQERQGIINRGLDSINTVFGGGQAPSTYSTAAGDLSAGTPYFTMKKGEYVPLDISKTNPRRLANWEKSGSIFTSSPGTKYQGFNDNFYNQRKQDYINYALPQIARQYKSASDSELFGLANRGLLGSSAAGTAKNNLSYALGQQEQNVSDVGQAQADQTRGQVETSRQNAINQLYATADPASATRSALSTSTQFRAPPIFAPIGNAFANLADQYAMSKILSQSQAGYNAGFAQGGGGGGGGIDYSIPSNS